MKEPPRHALLVTVLSFASIVSTSPAAASQESTEPTTCVALGDLDGDGWPDVVFGNRNHQNQLFYNDGKGRFDEFSPDVVTSQAAATQSVGLADLDGDGDLDILFMSADGQLRQLLNLGKRRFDAIDVAPSGWQPSTVPATAMGLGDLDADGNPDVVLAFLGAANRLLLNDGKGQFTVAALPVERQHTAVVHLADVDGDGDLDLLFGNCRDPKGRGGQDVLLLNDGKAQFTNATLPKDRSSTSAILLLDLDGDRRPDILKGVFGKRGGGRPRQYRNAGGGVFRGVKSSFTPGGLLDIRVAVGGDFDGDGDHDVLIYPRNAALRRWENNGKGRLRPAAKSRVPTAVIPSVTAMTVGDLDQDGDLDVVLAKDGSPNLILRNQGTKAGQPPGELLAEPNGSSFLNLRQATALAHIRQMEQEHGFKMADQARAGAGRYRFRRHGRKNTTDAAVATAITRGLEWLATHQSRDGRWDTDGFMANDPVKDRCTGPGNPAQDVGITALALLALLADGNTPFIGDYRQQVERGFTFLRRQQRSDGRIATAMVDFIYSHCMVTVALCEGYGLSGDPRLKQPAQAAIDYIARHQTSAGGWGYHRGRGKSDTPVTVWAVQAYRAALDFGLKVPEEDLGQARVWLNKVTAPASGRAGYSKRGESSSRHAGDHNTRFPVGKALALTAAAMYGRYLLGARRSESPTLERAAGSILRYPPRHEAGYTDYYYWFYGSQAMFQNGGAAAQTWRTKITEILLAAQQQTGSAKGSFEPDGPWGEDGGRVYSTALAVLSLQAPYRYALLDPR